MGVSIVSSVKTLEVEWQGARFPWRKKDRFSFNAGDKDALTAWYRNAAKMQEASAKVTDENALSVLYETERDVASMILGERAWRKIWRKSRHNVFSVLVIMRELVRIVKEEIDRLVAESGTEKKD